MDSEILMNDTNTYYCITTQLERDKMDISIFTTSEWEEMLKIFKLFDKTSTFVNNLSDRDYVKFDKQIISACYFCLHCEYLQNFDAFEPVSKFFVLEHVFVNVCNKQKLVINRFRRWISKNYVQIMENYAIMSLNNEFEYFK